MRALNLAASSKRGMSNLYSAGMGSRLDAVRLHKRIYKVYNDLLDNVIDHADVIKIDTEGHELEVLKGAHRLIAQKPVFVIEDHTKTLDLTYWPEVLRQLRDFKSRCIESSPYHDIILFEPQSNA